MLTATVHWQDGMLLDGVTGSGHHVMIEAAPEQGGQGRAAKPTELTLLSLGGCTGLDVVAIMRKMQLDVRSFAIELEADTAAEHPRVFTEIRLIYRTSGPDLPRERVDRAIRLSQERYCPVSHMLGKTARLVVISEVNGERQTLAF